ncbi:MAG: AAA family ATPase, partial [Methylobacterium mesophilicum]|nr:AAA family ATPase [Methylobacterium mesophilicum]
MYRLERIVLSNWGRLDPQDIDIDGSTAILGPTGAGKSTIVDALQVAITGASSRFYDLNKSTGGANTRTIRDYCLGADDHISIEGPARAGADTLVALCFRDRLSGEAVSFGLMFNATTDDPRETVQARFVAPGYALSLADLVELRPDGRRVVPLNRALLDRIKSACKGFKSHGTAMAYVDHYLLAMRKRGTAPDARQVLRNFRESIAFEPIDDPTAFVRRHILEKEDIDVAALKGSIERYRWLEAEVRKREQQLKDIAAVRGRFQTWATHLIRHNVLRFTAAHAEHRRLTLAIQRVEAIRTELAARIDREESAKRGSERRIRDNEDEIQRKRSVLADAPEALQLRALDQERAAIEQRQRDAGNAVRSRAASLTKLAVVARMRDQIPMRLHDGLDAAATFLSLMRGKTVETLAAYDTEMAETERRMMLLLEAEPSLAQQEEALNFEIATDRRALEELEQRLASTSSGVALSRETRDFIALLARDGIAAT